MPAAVYSYMLIYIAYTYIHSTLKTAQPCTSGLLIATLDSEFSAVDSESSVVDRVSPLWVFWTVAPYVHRNDLSIYAFGWKLFVEVCMRLCN